MEAHAQTGPDRVHLQDRNICPVVDEKTIETARSRGRLPRPVLSALAATDMALEYVRNRAYTLDDMKYIGTQFAAELTSVRTLPPEPYDERTNCYRVIFSYGEHQTAKLAFSVRSDGWSSFTKIINEAPRDNLPTQETPLDATIYALHTVWNSRPLWNSQERYDLKDLRSLDIFDDSPSTGTVRYGSVSRVELKGESSVKIAVRWIQDTHALLPRLEKLNLGVKEEIK